MTTAPNTAAADRPRSLGLRVSAALAGALLVAVAAQVSVPLPGTPVPMTLQPLAVLVVGGLLGARLGALSLTAYLAMGVAGLPVFTPGGLPGPARLFGPTGGYLLAYPVAAALVGRLSPAFGETVGRVGTVGTVRRVGTVGEVGEVGVLRAGLAALAGLVVIHAGGMAQLAILTGSAAAAFATGVLPFLLKDLANLIVAALVIRRFLPQTRALH